MNSQDIEISYWPPTPCCGMQTNAGTEGILAFDKLSGIGIICTRERSQFNNRKKAIELLCRIVEEQNAS